MPSATNFPGKFVASGWGTVVMRTVDELDVLGDEGLRARMLRWSLVVFVVTAVLTVGLLVLVQPTPLGLLASIGGGVAASLVVLPVHELLHAAAFKALGGRGLRVSFGYESGCLYTRTNDAVLPKGRFIVVLLTPSAVLTAALVGLGILLASPAAGVLAAGLHLTGCTGDLLMAWTIHQTPACVRVQDTATGCRLLG